MYCSTRIQSSSPDRAERTCGRPRSARMRSKASTNSPALSARITPLLPESPTGLSTNGNEPASPKPRSGEGGRSEVRGARPEERTENLGDGSPAAAMAARSEEHTSELQSQSNL